MEEDRGDTDIARGLQSLAPSGQASDNRSPLTLNLHSRHALHLRK